MLEIKFQGRGGQGVVVASELLGRACFEEGLYPQCFSVFGGERRGAPVAAFVRVSDRKIHLKCDVTKANHLILFDAEMVSPAQIAEQVADDGIVLFNGSRIRDPEIQRGMKMCFIDGLDIAKRNGLGSIVNTAVLGAYVGLSAIISLNTLLAVIAENVPSAVEQNIRAAKQAFDQVSTL